MQGTPCSLITFEDFITLTVRRVEGTEEYFEDEDYDDKGDNDGKDGDNDDNDAEE